MTRPIPIDDDLAAAIARLESVTGILKEAAREIPETAEGRDSTGMITVVLRNTGSIADLSIDHRWRDELAPSELGSALTEAITNARVGLLQGAEDYAALHRDDFEDIDAAATKERIEDASRQMLATASFVTPSSIEDVVEESLQKADTLKDLARDIESLASDDTSEEQIPTSHAPIVVRRAGGQATAVDVDAQWAKNTPTAMLIQRLVDAVVTVDDQPGVVADDDADMSILRLLSTLQSLSEMK